MTLAGLANPVASLPVPLTTFVGRTRELADLESLIVQPDVRLVTVTGPGGVGKTRLAIELADAVFGQFRDGVVYVALAPIGQAELLIPTIASAFGIESPGTDYDVDRLSRLIGDRQVLLVLDNFEHLVVAAGQIPHLLTKCPGLTIVVTSQTLLRVSGERQYPLSPLPFSVDASAQSNGDMPDSVRLFVDRARAVDPGFELTNENVEAVQAICARLEGLPLAIELAAARTNLLSVGGLRARLEHALPLLTGGARDLPLRQQTMRNTIAWSYQLLNDDEQRVVRRMAPLCCGFSFEVLEPSIAFEGEAPIDLLNVTASLVDKSLFHREIGAAGDTRYLMLETIREFALECLQAAGETDRALAHHAERYVQLAVDTQPNLIGHRGMQALWLKRIDDEFGNLRPVFDYLEQAGDTRSLLTLINALDWYFSTREPVPTSSWEEIALAADDRVDDLLRVEVLQGLSLMSGIRAEGARALRMAQAAFEIAERTSDPLTRGVARLSLGVAWELNDDNARALPMYLDSVTYLRTAGSKQFLPLTLSQVANQMSLAGELDMAEPLFDEALAIAKEVGDNYSVVVIKGQRAQSLRCRAQFPEAISHLRSSYELAVEIGSVRYIVGAISGLACVVLDLGYPEQAARWLGATENVHLCAGIKREPEAPWIRRAISAVHARLGDEKFRAAWEDGQRADWNEIQREALVLTVPISTGDGPLPAPVDHYGLTARECEVLQELVAGRSDREIAETLFIGQRTVQTHVSNLLAKLGVHNRAEAAVAAVREHLV
jgi:predicted ATPase/DNA-binding CsgD family transcriptional regulator